jgi:UDP-glucose:(heptosyl)LPS alpha-1,3-glucosyltransferase
MTVVATTRTETAENANDHRSNRRPVVALVAHEIHDRGGMERAFTELIKEAHQRYRFIVVAIDLEPALVQLVEWRRIRVPKRPFPLRFALFFLLARRRLRSIDVDVVHTLGAIVPGKADVATVQFCHAAFRAQTAHLPPAAQTSPARRVNRLIARKLALLAERWCYRKARVGVLAAVSNGVADEVRRHYSGPPVVLTPNGVDHRRFRRHPIARERERREFGVTPDDVVALFLGGDWARKGVDLAIEAIAEAKRLDVALRLWVVGTGDRKRFTALSTRLGVADRVTFFGPRVDTERFYRAADIFVLPTSYETFSLVAYEAAASELPVVAPPVSGIADLIGDDEAGILVRRESGSIAAALVRLARDPDLRRSLGHAGRRRSAPYTWRRSVEGVLAAYEVVLSRRGVRK